jgi:hypothetical protein
MLRKYFAAIMLYSSIEAMAFEGIQFTNIFPDSFYLKCTTIQVVGGVFSDLDMSYVKWDKATSTLTVNSEELDEYEHKLNPKYNEVSARAVYQGDIIVGVIQFKAKEFLNPSYGTEGKIFYDGTRRILSVNFHIPKVSHGKAKISFSELHVDAHYEGLIKLNKTMTAYCERSM